MRVKIIFISECPDGIEDCINVELEKLSDFFINDIKFYENLVIITYSEKTRK